MAGARVGERLDGIYNIYLVRTTINYQLNYACVHNYCNEVLKLAR